MFAYRSPVNADRIRVTFQARTEEMHGDVEMFVAMRFVEDVATYGFGIWEDGLVLLRLEFPGEGEGEDETILAQTPFWMSDHTTLTFTCEYDSGRLICTVKDSGGTVVASIQGTDPSPLPPGKVAIIGEIDGTIGEYVYLDDFRLEQMECD